MIEIGFVGENNVLEKLVRKYCLQVTRSNPFYQFAIIRTTHKRPPADDRQTARRIDFDWHGKALQPGVASIVSNCASRDCARMRFAAKRIAEFHMLRRRLDRLADRIIVADS